MSRKFQSQLVSFAACVFAVALLLACAPSAQAVIVLTQGLGATGVASTGLDTTTGPARASVAPVFDPTFTQVPKGSITVSGTSDLNANYAIGFINDNTGYNFLSDSVTGSGISGTNRGWIPSTSGLETASFMFNSPIRLAGIDFLTLFTSRTAGTFRFDYSLNNGGSWAEIATVTNNNSSEVFRQGFEFDDIIGVTNVRLVTTSASAQLFIGEVNFFAAPTPAPEPTSFVLLAAGCLLMQRAAKRSKAGVQ